MPSASSSHRRARQRRDPSATQLERLVQRLPVMVWMDDGKGRCTFNNEAWRNFTGRRRGEDLGTGWQAVVHPDDLRALTEAYEEALRFRRAFTAEFRLRRADGVYRRVSVSGAPRANARGSFEGHVGICVDVSERHETAEALARTRDREKSLEQQRDAHAALLEALIASLQDGVMAETDEGRVTVANEAYCRIFGLGRPEDVIGRSAHELRERLWQNVVRGPDGLRALTAELRRNRLPQLGLEIALTDGRIFDRDYIPVSGPAGAVHMWHYRDVTERRRLEGRLRESGRRLRELAARSEDVRERERRELARMLHDEMGQLMSSIRLELVGAINYFREAGEAKMRPAVDRLQAAAGLTDIAIQVLRTLTSELRPPILDHLGLVAALRLQATIFSTRTGIRCHVRSRPAEIAFDPAQTTALFRIALEALENVHRHSGAGTAWIHVARRRGASVLEVRDNGRGVSQDDVDNPRTMGVLGMRERALAVGAELRVSSPRRRGTRVLVIVPDAAHE